MSRRLTSMLRSEDTVSRVGESELVAVMTIENERFIGPLMQRVQDVLDDPIAVSGGRVQVSANLGTVTATSAESAEEVLARAGRRGVAPVRHGRRPPGRRPPVRSFRPS